MMIVRIGRALAGVLLFVLFSQPALAQLDKCRFYILLQNKQRYVEGAPWSAECGHGSWHTPPWGNWGVDSNGGRRIDGYQFAGWKAMDGWLEWNSCKRDYRPPNPDVYNAAGNTEQASTGGAYWYGSIVLDKHAGSRGCTLYRGLTVASNWMEMRELDRWDDDERTGDLAFPDLHVNLSCDEQGCDTATSSSVSPSWARGYADDPYAKIFMVVDAELIEGTSPAPAANDGLAANVTPTFARSPFLASFAAHPFVAIGIGPYLGGAWFGAIQPKHSISGPVELTVVDAQDGRPIAGATVLFVEESGGQIVIDNERTSANGKATITADLGDAPELFVFAHGYAVGRHRLAQPPRPSFAHRRGRTSPPVETRPAARLALRRAGRISGSVTDANGNPVAHAEIELIAAPEPSIVAFGEARVVSVGEYGRTFRTDANGTFEIRNVEASTAFSIRVLHPTRGSVRSGVLTVQPGEHRTGLKMVLR